jgi:predicted ABC-type sugar transport system permease subunit
MFQFGQIINILQVAAFLGVVATGQTLVVLIGGIDLSVAGMVTMANIVSTSIMAGQAGNTLIAMIVCLLMAAALGLVKWSDDHCDTRYPAGSDSGDELDSSRCRDCGLDFLFL